MPNSLFFHASLDILPAERAQELEDFAVKALNVIGTSPGAKISSIEEADWDELRDTKGLTDPIYKTRGCLDYVILAVEEGIDLEENWEKLHAGVFEALVDELHNYGLHGLHFRMGVVDPTLRGKLTMRLADAISSYNGRYGFMATSIDHRPHYPIDILSCTSHATGIQEDYARWVKGDGARIEKHPYSIEQIQALRLMGSASSPDQHAVQDAALAHLITEKTTLPFDTLDEVNQAVQIEKALQTLVYNRGYRLHVEGMSCQEISTYLTPVIRQILGHMPLPAELSKALERQVLVNLFSAFPEGLKLLQVTPEELQGVPQNPMVLASSLAICFKHTFSGPLVIFPAGMSTPYAHRTTQVADYLEACGYPLHPDLAFGGFLFEPQLHDQLILNCHSHSTVIEECVLPAYEQKQDPHLKIQFEQELPMSLVNHLINPHILKLYGDQAALTIIRIALPLASRRGIEPIAELFRERPHLVLPTLELMLEDYYLNEAAFKLCGFGMKELRLLGDRAPETMLSFYLERDLGL